MPDAQVVLTERSYLHFCFLHRYEEYRRKNIILCTSSKMQPRCAINARDLYQQNAAEEALS